MLTGSDECPTGHGEKNLCHGRRCKNRIYIYIYIKCRSKHRTYLTKCILEF